MIHGINAVKKPRRSYRLVALQVADQVPPRRQPFCSGTLPFPLLNTVFAEVPHARFKCFAYGACWMRFGYSNQRNLVVISPRVRRSAGDSLLDSEELFPH